MSTFAEYKFTCNGDRSWARPVCLLDVWCPSWGQWVAVPSCQTLAQKGRSGLTHVASCCTHTYTCPGTADDMRALCCWGPLITQPFPCGHAGRGRGVCLSAHGVPQGHHWRCGSLSIQPSLPFNLSALSVPIYLSSQPSFSSTNLTSMFWSIWLNLSSSLLAHNI